MWDISGQDLGYLLIKKASDCCRVLIHTLWSPLGRAQGRKGFIYTSQKLFFLQRLCLIGIFQNLLNKEGIEPLVESLWFSSLCLPLVKAGASLHRHTQELSLLSQVSHSPNSVTKTFPWAPLSTKSDCLEQVSKFPQNPKYFGLGETLKTIYGNFTFISRT